MKRKEDTDRNDILIREATAVYNINPTVNSLHFVSDKLRHNTIYNSIENVLFKFLHSLEHEDNDQLKKVASYFTEAAKQPEASNSDLKLASILTEGRSYRPEEKIALEASARIREYEHRRLVLNDAIGSSLVSKLLNTSRQTPHDRVKSGTLLAVKEGSKLLFPVWQFDVTGPNGVLEGLPSVLAALDLNEFMKASWFINPNRSLGGRTPAQALKQGDLDKVMIEARAVGAN